jgi:hypothetical protein
MHILSAPRANVAIGFALSVGVLFGSPLPAAAEPTDALRNARDATAAFNDPTAALAGGYSLLTDAADIACIDMQGAGGMGVHYVNGKLVESGTIDVARPQALVYAVQPSGGLRLVSLEYVALQAAWDANHQAPPALFGETFQLTPAENRFGLPAFYSLHAWIGQTNPSGVFSPWNPQVTCAIPVSAGDDHEARASLFHSTFLCPLPNDMAIPDQSLRPGPR